MEKTTNLIKGQKYRVFTRILEVTYIGPDDESGNPIFRHGTFPAQMIPWTAIERLDMVPVTEANMK